MPNVGREGPPPAGHDPLSIHGYNMLRPRRLPVLMALATLLAACSDATSPTATDPSFAQGGGGGGGGGGPVPAVCAQITVTNNAPTVRHRNMPNARYNLQNCGSTPLGVTVTFSELPGFLSVLCPAPLAPPASFQLAVKAKLSVAAPVFRGPCGLTSNVNGVLMQGTQWFQGHNLQLTVTNNATGQVLSRGQFNWQDALRPGA